MRITVKSKFTDVLVTVLTLGLIVPRTGAGVRASSPVRPAAAAATPAAAPPARRCPLAAAAPAPAGQVPAQR